MSTKIYNGYRLNRDDITPIELREFQKEFREIAMKIYCGKYNKAFANYIKCKVRDLVLLDITLKNSDDKLPNMLNLIGSILRSFEINYRDIDSLLDGDELDTSKYSCMNLQETILKDKITTRRLFSWKEMAHDYVDRKSDFARMSPLRSDSAIEGSLSIIPIHDSILILAYGTCEEVMDFILHSPGTDETHNLIKKYNLEYYGYWNNTDPDDSVSEEDWDKREKDWEEALPSGVPAVHGFSVEIGGSYDLSTASLNLRRSRYKDVLSILVPSLTKRSLAETAYKNQRRNELTKDIPSDSSTSDWIQALREADKVIKETWDDSKVTEIESSIELPEINEEFLSSNFLNSVPNLKSRFIDSFQDK